MFGKKSAPQTSTGGRLADFAYLSTNDIYLDSACQSMRPKAVIEALNDYYTKYNACGDRVKYAWGQKVDANLETAREAVIGLLGLSAKDYVCSFTLNTSYGINLILSQLPAGYNRVVTSEIEHNSVFLPTIELAERLKRPRIVLSRQQDGSLNYSPSDLTDAVVVINSTSNIDGRQLKNVNEVIIDTHQGGGIIIIDAAQTMAHFRDLLKNAQADAICFSAHKMYAPTLGVIVIRKELLHRLSKTFVGGGMVTSVSQQDYKLLPNELHTGLEPGLQAYGEISALIKAIDWLKNVQPFGQNPTDYMAMLSSRLFDGLKTIEDIKIFNRAASPVISIYPKKGDAHRLAIFLSHAGIMARSGSFCCHYYLEEVLKSPPFLRLSLGLHNTIEDVDKTIQTISKITKG